MIEFYLWCALLLVSGLLFVVLPWLKRSSASSSETLSNTRLIKQRLDELKSEEQHGLLSEVDRQQAENELKLAVLEETDDIEKKASNINLVIILGMVVCLSAGVTVYFQANQIQKIAHWKLAKADTSELGQRVLEGDKTLELRDLQNFALGLRSRLIEEPNDPIGWMLLGRISGAINRVDSSIQAFEKSLKLEPDNTSTMASYAQALLMTGQESGIEQAKQVLFRILELEPNNTNAMGVLAVVASELGDKQLALDNWQRLIHFVPETDANYAAINQRIEQLKGELVNQTSGMGSKAKVTESAHSKRVEVTVDINEKLTHQLPDDGFLFVFAQESSGQVRMPAAVVKIPLGSFPVVVELSDENAMMANYTLSQLEQAKLVARVSKDENVMPSAGELQGEQVVVLSADGQTQETITIDREL